MLLPGPGQVWVRVPGKRQARDAKIRGGQLNAVFPATFAVCRVWTSPPSSTP